MVDSDDSHSDTPTDDSDPFALNPGHYFELLDRTSVAESYLAIALGGSPVLSKHSELQALYDQACEKLAALYHAVAQFEETWE